MWNVNVELPKKHNAQQIRAEADIMLGDYPAPVMAIGHLMRLAQVASSLLSDDTTPGEDDLLKARLCFETDDITAEDYDGIREQIQASWRALETIVPSSSRAPEEKRSVIPIFSPEWLADMLCTAMKAMPGQTVDYFLWHCPFVLMCHAICALHRANGGITERPADGNFIGNVLETLNHGNRPERTDSETEGGQ